MLARRRSNYGTIAGIGAAIVLSYRNFVGLAVGGRGSATGIGAAIPGVAVLAGGVVPELPATEFTVCLDRGTYPASPGAPAAVIVVQNDYSDRYPNDGGMTPPTPVWVRVVGTSGRVMRRIAVTAPAPLVQPQAPADASCLSAGGPMPVPLQGAPAVASLPPVESYGYRQALGQALYQHWTIEP